MRSTVLALAGALLLAAPPAHAQPDFSALDAKTGDTVRVISPDGRHAEGPIVDLSASEILVGTLRIEPAPGLTIDRDGDSVMNGFLWGIAWGAAAFLTYAGQECDTRAQCIPAGILYMGGFGALVDWAHRGRTVLFRGTTRDAGRSSGLQPAVHISPDSVALTLAIRSGRRQ